MRFAALLSVLSLHASLAAADPGKRTQICLASGISGNPLHRCFLDGEFGPAWNGEQLPFDKGLRAWAGRWFPVGSPHVGWTASGERRTTRVRSHHFDGDLDAPIVEFDERVALVSSGPLDLRVVTSHPGTLSGKERRTLAAEAERLWARAITLRARDAPADDRFDLGDPKVLAVPGSPGLRTVYFPMTFGPDKDGRGSFFFLLDGKGTITFGRFGHIEWSPVGPEEVARFEPLFFFRIGADPKTYLLADYAQAWESWDLVAIIDPVRAQVVSY